MLEDRHGELRVRYTDSEKMSTQRATRHWDPPGLRSWMSVESTLSRRVASDRWAPGVARNPITDSYHDLMHSYVEFRATCKGRTVPPSGIWEEMFPVSGKSLPRGWFALAFMLASSMQ